MLSPKVVPSKPSSPELPGRQSTFVDVGTEDLPKPAPCVGRSPLEATGPPSNLILPPPPPMWYPPLYNPQFGVDPLNFFIDLRVSGHIYDRKRPINEGVDGVEQEGRTEDSGLDKRIGKEIGHRPRHLSAFSVPVRLNQGSTEGCDKLFEQNSVKYNGKPNSTSYVMKNLKRVYDNLHNFDKRSESKNKDHHEDTKAENSDLDDDIMD